MACYISIHYPAIVLYRHAIGSVPPGNPDAYPYYRIGSVDDFSRTANAGGDYQIISGKEAITEILLSLGIKNALP
jgi:hypothetical protein